MTNPDYRALCAELLGALENEGYAHWPGGADGDPLIERARVALAAEPVGEGPINWPAYFLRVADKQAREIQELIEQAPPGKVEPLPATAPVPEPGEVAELAAELRHFIAGYQQMRGLDPEHVYSIHRGDAMEAHLRISRLSLIAELLERHAPQPVPGASATYFEFVVLDGYDCTQAAGIALTYAQALSEGQHYLAQYQQDGPHELELRRVEVLNPDALPLPAPEGGEVQP